MRKNTFTARSEYSGWFKIEAHRVDSEGNEIPGSRRVAADWFPNLITNSGLDFFGTTDFTYVYQFCRVGSGNTAPAFTDTALVSQIATSSTEQAVANGVNRTGSFYAWRRRTVRFAAGSMGVSAVNLAEVAVSPAGTGSVFSRALILDPGGLPITISVQPDEVLDVTYELRLYPSLTDATGTVIIASVSYDWIARALIGSSQDARWSAYLGRGIGPRLALGNTGDGPTVASVLPAQTADVSSPIETDAMTASAYTPGAYARSFVFNVGLNKGNVVGGIGCFYAGTESSGGQTFGAWGWGLTPKLPKTAQFVATFTIRMTWGRYTP